MGIRSLALTLLVAGIGCAQTATPTTFDLADVHVSEKSNLSISGGQIRLGRFELHRATMVDLIRLAYGTDADRVVGGPSWLEIDRFDVTATTPRETTQEQANQMLQSLLANRFKLIVHTETKDLPGFALTAGKKTQLKETDGPGEQGCKYTINAPNAQQAAARAAAAQGGVATPIAIVPVINYTCHAETMKAFAEGIRNMVVTQQYLNNGQVVDRTNLDGAWDFSFQYSLPVRNLAGAAPETTTLFAAMEKLGLKLEAAKIPTTVYRVDSVNQKPTDNPPDVTKLLPPPPPAEFEVADIRPTAPGATNTNLNLQPSGRFEARNIPLRTLISLAWNGALNSNDDMVGLPKFAETARFDIIAKAPTEGGEAINSEAILLMLRNLLIDRFKMVSHTEERPAISYNLTASKPKLQKADPSNRAGCKDGQPDPKNPSPTPLRIFNCQNITMAQFADQLQRIGQGYIKTPVLDMTGLEGAWDFSLSFSPSELVNGTVRINTGDPNGNPSDPSGAISLFDGLSKIGLKLEQTKRPAPVFVIDHIEEKPTDN